MFKSAASVSSLAYNFLLSFLLLFAYNGIFLQKLYAVTGSGWDFVSVNLIVFLFLFAACNLLLVAENGQTAGRVFSYGQCRSAFISWRLSYRHRQNHAAERAGNRFGGSRRLV